MAKLEKGKGKEWSIKKREFKVMKEWEVSLKRYGLDRNLLMNECVDLYRKNGRNEMGVKMEQNKNRFRKMEISMGTMLLFQSR